MRVSWQCLYYAVATFIYTDLEVSLPDSTSVEERDGAVSRVCAVITTLESIQNNFVISLYTIDDTGTYLYIDTVL